MPKRAILPSYFYGLNKAILPQYKLDKAILPQYKLNKEK